MNKLQIKLERLELMLIEDGYNNSNIVLQTVIDMQKEAINYTLCCTELCDYCKKPLKSTTCNECLKEMDSHNH